MEVEIVSNSCIHEKSCFFYRLLYCCWGVYGLVHTGLYVILSYKLEGLAKDKDCSFLSSVPPLCTCLCAQSISAKLVPVWFPHGQPWPTLLPPLNVISKPRKQRCCLLVVGRGDFATGRNPGPLFIHTFINNFVATLVSANAEGYPCLRSSPSSSMSRIFRAWGSRGRGEGPQQSP